jgi:hemolysin D
MLAQTEQQAGKILSLDQQIAQKAAEAEEITATVDKLEAELPFIQETADARQQLLKMEFCDRLAYLDAQLKLSEQQHDLIVQKRRAAETVAAKAALEAQRDQTRAEYAHGVMTDPAEAEQKARTTHRGYCQGRAQDEGPDPARAGRRHRIAIHTVGGVVTPAEQLIAIVPTDSRLEAEAMIPNRDIGFVVAGQSAQVKIDTFNFTKYGLLHGEMISASQDAIARDKPADRNDPSKSRAALSDTSEPQGHELVYSRPHLARPHADAGRGQDGQPRARDGGDGRDQDWPAPRDRISPLAAAALRA